jgi:hypothetical protein
LLETLRTVAGQTIQWLKEKDNKYLKTLHWKINWAENKTVVVFFIIFALSIYKTKYNIPIIPFQVNC